MLRQKHPDRDGVAVPGAIRWDDGEDTCRTYRPQPAPLCRLHMAPLVDQLPARCPLRSECASRAIETMLDMAYEELASNRDDADRVGAMVMRDRAETCLACVRANAADPRVKRLRRLVGVSI